MALVVLGGSPKGNAVTGASIIAAAQGFGGFVGAILKAAGQEIAGPLARVPSDAIILVNVNILEHQRLKEFDGPTYLWTRHRIRFRAVYNPLLNSYNQNNRNELPSLRAGWKAPVTDVALRHYLSQPRRSFQLFVGGQLYFQSPRAGTEVDAQQGPFPRVNNIALISGTKTFLVDYTLESCLNESYLFTSHPTVMLSHTFSSQNDIDQDFYTTRVINGHARFDTSRLLQLGARADEFRAWLFHAIPPGFHRAHIHVQVDEMGGQLAYSIVDRELTHSIGKYAADRGATRIACTHSSEISKPDIEDYAGEILGIGGDTAGKINKTRGAMNKGNMSMPKGAGAANIGMAVIGAGWNILRNVPRNTQTITCTVWGNKNSTRGGLRAVAANILRFRMMNLTYFLGATHASWHDDVHGKYVHGEVTIISPPVVSFLKDSLPDGFGLTPALQTFLNQSAKVRPLFPPAPGILAPPVVAPPLPGFPGVITIGPEISEDIEDVLTDRPQVVVRPPSVSPSPFGAAEGEIRLTADTGARGTYLESLISSALLAPNESPPEAVGDPYAKSRTPPDGTVTNPTFP